jgi:hypothetical protein
VVQEWCTAPRTDRTGWTYHTGLNPWPSPHPAAADVRLFLAGDGKLWTVDVATERARHFDMPVLAPTDRSPGQLRGREGGEGRSIGRVDAVWSFCEGFGCAIPPAQAA